MLLCITTDSRCKRICQSTLSMLGNNMQAPFRRVKIKNQDRGKKDVSTYLEIDTVDLSVLVLQLGAHVNGHVTQITYHGVHLLHVVFHLVFTGIVRYPSDIATLRSESVTVVHYTLRLVIDYFTIVVAFPRSFILLE